MLAGYYSFYAVYMYTVQACRVYACAGYTKLFLARLGNFIGFMHVWVTCMKKLHCSILTPEFNMMVLQWNCTDGVRVVVVESRW